MTIIPYMLLTLACVALAVAVFVSILRWVLRINTIVDAMEFQCEELEKVNYNLSKLVQQKEVPYD